jgi:hypothetical protein
MFLRFIISDRKITKKIGKEGWKTGKIFIGMHFFHFSLITYHFFFVSLQSRNDKKQ